MYDRILIPTDGSETAELAVERALAIAEQFDSAVDTLYVVDTDALELSLGTEQVDRVRSGRFGEMDELEAKAREATDHVVEAGRERGVDVTAHFRAGQPHKVIADFAEDQDVDLVVMGSHGRSGLSRVVLGSVAEKVLRRTRLPVLVVDVHGDHVE